MEIETLLITQARVGSTRLPGKVLKEIQSKPLLQIHLQRLHQCRQVSKILVATTTNPADEIIYNKVRDWGFESFRGSENDVLDRYYQAALPHKPKWVVRVTSDCPLIDPSLVDDVINFVKTSKADYGANNFDERFPDGQDVEVFTFASLERCWKEATKNSEREHVTPYIRNNSNIKGGDKFFAVSFSTSDDFSKIRMTVDEPADFELIKRLIDDLGTNKSWKAYVEHMIAHNLSEINSNIIRNEGLLKSLKKD